MQKKVFRTYHRRPVTRRSGFKVSGNKSGGECIILTSESYECSKKVEKFVFKRDKLDLQELFESNLGIVAFGGYVHTLEKLKVHFKLTFKISGYDEEFEYSKSLVKPLEPNTWSPLGFHKEISLELGDIIQDVCVEVIFESVSDHNILQFIGFDFDSINYEGYKDSSLFEDFKKKTFMHVPQIYYLQTHLPFASYLHSPHHDMLGIGDDVVLKGCNRCDRYLPINIYDEIQTLGFSLHCKKKAPCKHPLFNKYKIDNLDDLNHDNLNADFIQDGFVTTHYGHQLECTPCKKYYVNAALNPLRNSQQFREDSLRRRAIEVLVNNLLDRNIVHFEFLKRTKKEFSEFIWNKFGQRCFKCGIKLQLDEMHLDHTMPLAFLYRLDETATCLCAEHNSSKRDHFPVQFYSESELMKLQEITGIDDDTIRSTKANQQVIDLLIENVVWFFDDFLNEPDYQKVRDGRLTADKIYASIVRVIKANGDIDLVQEYYSRTCKFPETISGN
ncbi:HNH endonuclease [Paenibacillus sp. y28]|uniref:HNH endonuclease n=1 Tax=Paenibacillus sp. y28 TaxID=3129110 RepID=UPI00301A853F